MKHQNNTLSHKNTSKLDVHVSKKFNMILQHANFSESILDLLKILSYNIKTINEVRYRKIHKSLCKKIKMQINGHKAPRKDVTEINEINKEDIISFFETPLPTLFKSVLQQPKQQDTMNKLLIKQLVESTHEQDEQKLKLLKITNDEIYQYNQMLKSNNTNYNRYVIMTQYKYQSIINLLSEVVNQSKKIAMLSLNCVVNNVFSHPSVVDELYAKITNGPDEYQEIYTILLNDINVNDYNRKSKAIILLFEKLSQSENNFLEINEILSEYIKNNPIKSLAIIYSIFTEIINKPNEYTEIIELLLNNISDQFYDDHNITKVFSKKILNQLNDSETINTLVLAATKNYVFQHVNQCLELFSDLMTWDNGRYNLMIKQKATRKFIKIVADIVKTYNQNDRFEQKAQLSPKQFTKIFKKLSYGNKITDEQDKIIETIVNKFGLPDAIEVTTYYHIFFNYLTKLQIKFNFVPNDTSLNNNDNACETSKNQVIFYHNNSLKKNKVISKFLEHESVDLKTLLNFIEYIFELSLSLLESWVGKYYEVYFAHKASKESVMYGIHKLIENIVINLLDIHNKKNSSKTELSINELNILVEIQEKYNKTIKCMQDNEKAKLPFGFIGQYIEVVETLLKKDSNLSQYIPQIKQKISELGFAELSLWQNLEKNFTESNINENNLGDNIPSVFDNDDHVKVEESDLNTNLIGHHE